MLASRMVKESPKVEQRDHPQSTRAPVYPAYFADPFVWKHGDQYFAIGTGESEACGDPAERVFPLLSSKDFFHWESAGSAMVRPGHALGKNFWAPEVAFADGKFYLYYSVGHEDKNHQLRVAISDSPLGPYRDCGIALIDPSRCPFAIDAHPFRDDDGQWYLFYARDFLDSTGEVRSGTALMVARLESMTRLADEGCVVLRACSDWQRFQFERPMYGGIMTGTRSKDRACANTRAVTTAFTAAVVGRMKATAWTTVWPIT